MAGLALLCAGCSSLTDGLECEAPRAAMAVPASGALDVLSWNVNGLPFEATLGERIDRIAAVIRSERPDVVLLQEAWRDDAAGRFDCRLRADYVRVPDPDGVRTGLLALYGHRRGGLLAYVRRDSAWRIDGASVPRFEEFVETGPGHRVLDERDAIAGKGFKQFALFDGRLRVDVLNTHLQARYRGRDYASVRAAQLAQLLERADASRADVTLVAGDFNIAPGEAALYARLTAGLIDLTAEYRGDCACATFTESDDPASWWIDYVLARARPGLRVEQSAGLIRNTARNEPYSDHHGVRVRLAISPSPPR